MVDNLSERESIIILVVYHICKKILGVFRELLWHIEIADSDLFVDFGNLVSVEWQLPCQDLINHNSHRPNISFFSIPAIQSFR